MISGVGVDLVISDFLRVAKDQPQLGEGFRGMGCSGAVKTNDSKSNHGLELVASVLLCSRWLSRLLSFCSAFSLPDLPSLEMARQHSSMF